MAKFIKKPVVIDAYTFDELFETYTRLETELNGFQLGNHLVKFVQGKSWTPGCTKLYSADAHFIIHTLEGKMTMSQSDMLIIGVRGECYPCKIDIFNETYDKVENKPSTLDWGLIDSFINATHPMKNTNEGRYPIS